MSSTRIRTHKDGSAYYQVLWLEKGTRRSESFDDPASAARWRKLLDQVGPVRAREILSAAYDDRPLITLTEWCTTYIGGLTGVQEGTRRRYAAVVNNDITPTIGALPLDSVTETTTGRWVQDLTESGASGKTVKNKHGFLSGALNAAVKAGHMRRNPCEGMRLPTTEREEMCFLTPSDFAVLLGYISPHWQPLVTVLISTGMRWSEATALQVRDIDTDRHSLRVSRAWKYTAEAAHRLGAPKSRMSVRTIALAPETMGVLLPLIGGRNGSEFVFTNRRGGVVRNTPFHNSVWRPAIRLANGEPATSNTRIGTVRDASGNEILPAMVPLGKRPRVHDLRHSHASWLVAAGVPLPVVQQRLGHEDISTTIRSYTHLDASTMLAAVTATSRALAQALPEVQPALR